MFIMFMLKLKIGLSILLKDKKECGHGGNILASSWPKIHRFKPDEV